MNSTVFLIVLLIQGELYAQSRRKREEPQVPPPQTADLDLEELQQADSSFHSLQAGKFSMEVSFPGGGSSSGQSTAGIRVMTPKLIGISGLVHFSYDRKEDQNSFGGILRVQKFLISGAKAFPYFMTQLSAGKNNNSSADNSDATQITSFQLGAAIGLGVEYFLLKELSTSAEVALGARLLPSSQTRIATNTSQISLHYHFGF